MIFKTLSEYDDEKKRLALYDKCASKITDSSLIYQMCALRIMQRFELELRWDNYPPHVCYKILDYYIENVDEDCGDLVVIDDDEGILDCLRHGIDTINVCLNGEYRIKKEEL